MASTTNTVITEARRKKLVRASAGLIPLPAITGMAFGDGGVDSGGNVLPPEEGQAALRHEIYRKETDSRTAVSDFSVRYSCILGETVLTGKSISEIALYDGDGDLVCIRTMSAKGKDEGLEMIFTLDDEF